MKIPVFPHKAFNPLHLRFFFSFLAISLIVLILSISMLYMFTVKITTGLLHESAQDTLLKESYSATLMREYAVNLCLQMYSDSEIRKMLFNVTDDINELQVPIQRLNSYKNSSPFIQSIYIYNARTDKIFAEDSNNWLHTSATFSDSSVFDLIYESSIEFQLVPIPRIIKSNINGIEKNTCVYTFLFFDLSSRSSTSDKNSMNMIILNISEEWMRSIIHSLGKQLTNYTMIIDKNGQTVINDNKYKFLTSLTSEPFIDRILNSNAQNGYFTEMINHEKYLVTFMVSDLYEWRFINLIPYNNFTQKLDNIKTISILIATLTLIIGFYLSFEISRSLYKPIHTLKEDLLKLESDKRNNQYTLKHQALKNVVNADYGGSIELLQKKLTDLRISLDISGSYRIILFKIDHYHHFCSLNNSTDQALYRFAIANVAGELISNRFISESLDMEEDHILVILNCDILETEEEIEALKTITSQVQQEVKQHLDISISAVISNLAPTIENIGNIYNQSRYFAAFRLFFGHQCIIKSSDIHTANSEDYLYPTQLERNFSNALFLGKIEDAKQLCEEIINSTLNYSWEVLWHTANYIAFTIYNFAGSLEKNSGWAISFSYDTFITTLNQLETLEEIRTHFNNIIENVIIIGDERTDLKHESLISHINKLVNDKYSDPNLSTDSIADLVEMSSKYLGRLYKKHTNKSIVESISDVRVKKAQELLLTTSMPISDISEKVGILNISYFYTLFKKSLGSTPSEYRQQNLANKDEQ